MLKDKKKIKEVIIIIIITIMCGLIFFYQTKKVGFHEDEVYTIASSINPYDGLMSAYQEKDVETVMYEKYIKDDNPIKKIINSIMYIKNYNNYLEEREEFYNNQVPIWKTKEDVTNYMTLKRENIFNYEAIYINQAKDNHPPFFYTLVHISDILFCGNFSKYTVFLVNIIAFILSCLVIKNIFKLINKENLTIPALIFYGLSMGTISMVIYQRMYMLLTFFVLLYFYYSIKIYKNNFYLTKELVVKLGIVTVLGFLTQYFFAIYALMIFLLMVIKMIKDKKINTAFKYIGFHVIYSVIGILLFVPCIDDLLHSSRGISNLSNGNYFEHFVTYLKHLAYAFTIKGDMAIILLCLVLLAIGIIYFCKKEKEKFVLLLSVIPSVVFFFVVVKLTSFQELRYIMPIIPFVVIIVFLLLDSFVKTKYKNIIFITISIVLVLNGMVFSKPKFLYDSYQECLEIAQENKDKSFVYVYDNFFNHMQSVPEMMIYKKTLIINTNRNEVEFFINNEELNNEDSYILCIKTYMNNEEILEKIKNSTEFKNITKIFEGINSTEEVNNNLYLVSK